MAAAHFQPGGPIDAAIRPGRDIFPGFGIDTHELKPFPGMGLPDVDDAWRSPPGYQMPTPGLPDPKPPEGNQQYFLQMRQSIESLGEALKQIEGMQTPGGQYSGGGAQMMKPGGFIANTDNAVGK